MHIDTAIKNHIHQTCLVRNQQQLFSIKYSSMFNARDNSMFLYWVIGILLFVLVFFKCFLNMPSLSQSVGEKKRGLTRIRRINHCSDEFMQINFKEHVPPMIVNYYAICRDMSNHKSNPFCRRKKNNPSIRWFDKKSGIHRVRNPSRRSCWLCLILIGWFICFLSRRHANVTAESEKSEINRIHSSSESESDAIAIFDSEH